VTTPKPATPTTAAAHAALLADFDAGDTQDFEDARRGLVAPLPDGGRITGADGAEVWNLAAFQFVNDGAAPDTVHPSLWRQTQLLTEAGLFQVTDRIYQVRSADLSNIDFIEGDTGIIVVDPLISAETAAAALALYYGHRPHKPVVAVIYTHSHVDHFGGVRGVTTPEDVASGAVAVYAPVGFTDAALAENVMAGNAMGRRATYMYGNLLPNGPTGVVSPGLGLGTSTGSVGFIAPTVEITEPVEEVVIDGLRFTFLLAPETEAPAEMLFHLPDLRALCSAEDATHTLHNLYTLRGARTRDAKRWAHYLNRTIDLFGDATDVVFAQHHWPTWGHDRAVAFLEHQRDAYKYLHDQTLRLANQGYTMLEIAELVEYPPGLGAHWCNRGYYGSVNHNVKAVYNWYLGFFDGNPSTLHQLPPVDAANRYVEYMGGADAVVARARESFEAGDYRWVAQVVNHVVFADPTYTAARELAADALEQLGYQTENGVWRNFYLSGAQELRGGVVRGPAPNPASGDTIDAMPVGTILDYLAVRLNAERARDVSISVNLVFSDAGTTLVQVRDSVLNHYPDRTDPGADVTVRSSFAAFRAALLGTTSFADGVGAGDIVIEGDAGVLVELVGLFDEFDFWFPIVEP